MKGRIFWISLLLIGISWIANSIYAHSKQLDEPIFLEHYIDTTLQENNHIPLYYLTNLNDSSSISYVTIDGITNYIVQDHFHSDFGFNNHADVNQNLQSFTHHALRNIRLNLNAFELENLLQDGKFTFNEIEVFFNDGKSMTVPIGEITIHENRTGNNYNPLSFISGSGSNDGSSQSTYQVTENLSIENITFKYDDILQEYLLFKIDSKNHSTTNNHFYTDFPQDWESIPGMDRQNIELPYKLEKDEVFNIHTQISPEFIGYLESTIEFSGTTKTGETFTFSNSLLSQQPYLSQKDVNKMIQE